VINNFLSNAFYKNDLSKIIVILSAAFVCVQASLGIHLEEQKRNLLVRYEISSENTKYSLGDPVFIEAKIINLSDMDILISPDRIGLEMFVIYPPITEKNIKGNTENYLLKCKHFHLLHYNNTDIKYVSLRKNQMFGKKIALSDQSELFCEPGIYEIEMVFTYLNIPINPRIIENPGMIEIDLKHRAGFKDIEDDLFSNWLKIEIVESKNKIKH